MTTASWRAGVVSVSAGPLMTSVDVACVVSGAGDESTTATLNENTPDRAGVPVTRPLLLRDKPCGSCAFVGRYHTNGAAPPDTVSCCKYLSLTVAIGSGEAVVMTGDTATVTVTVAVLLSAWPSVAV